MKISFNNIEIASEFPDGGTDAIMGFQAEGKSLRQPGEFPRAPYAADIARGNRRNTMVGQIRPAPAPTLDEALLQMEGFYASLPDQADLVKVQGSTTVTYPNAILDSIKPLKDLYGVGYGFELTFIAGKPTTKVAGGAEIGTQSGIAIATESGTPISTE